jgi:hypothetical protein
LKIEFDNNQRLKKQHQELQKNYTQVERTQSDLHEKYQELIANKLKVEKDMLTQQGNLDQEKNAKYMAMEKIHELEGKRRHVCQTMSRSCRSCRKVQYNDD